MNPEPPPLPDKGPERQILLEALRAYSVNCSAPSLTEGCPFSVDLGPGVRGCGSECEALLAENGVDLFAGGIALDDQGIAATPRAAPRPRDEARSSSLFDAAEFYYRESDRADVSTWHTGALLYALMDSLSQPPHSRPGSADSLSEWITVLDGRGFVVEDVIRYGIRGPLLQSLAVFVAITPLEITSGLVEELQLDTEWLGRWVSLRDEYYERHKPGGADLAVRRITGEELRPVDAAERDRMAFTIAGPFLKILEKWLEVSSIEEIVSWEPRPLSDLSQRGALVPMTSDTKDLQWLVDRFTTTYLPEWNYESLRCEWRYIRGWKSAPVSRREMLARSVDVSQLSTLLADSECSGRADAVRARIGVVEAIKLIRAGQRAAAVALCNVFRESNPQDPSAHNNYGFCLIPDSTEEALDALLHAHRLGANDTVNLANRMLALYWLGRSAAALEIADAAIADWSNQDQRAIAYLWSFDAGREQAQLLDRRCPRCYVKRLALHIAKESGDGLAVARYGGG